MPVDLSVIGRKLDSSVYEYSHKDLILYALGVGCGPDDLEFVYEQDLKVLPTFSSVLNHMPPFIASTSCLHRYRLRP